MSKDFPTADRPPRTSEHEGGPDGAALSSSSAAGEERNGVPPPVPSKAEFEAANRRRLVLVDKEVDGTLTPAEEEELRRLEAKVRAYVKVHFSGPSEILDRAEEQARRLGYTR